MRFGIFSDVHGHLGALKTVLKDMEDAGVERPVCLGDIVGRGPNSVACLELIQGLNCPIVQGNHDQFSSWPDFDEAEDYMPFQLSRSKRLNSEQKAFLGKIPLLQTVQNFTIVHASVHKPDLWNYIDCKEQANASFDVMTGSLAFYGHTHVPRAYIRGSETQSVPYTTLEIEPGYKYLINPGSVGEPRDRDRRGAYAIYDDKVQTVELRRFAL